MYRNRIIMKKQLKLHLFHDSLGIQVSNCDGQIHLLSWAWQIIVDAVNSVDKNTILRRSMRKVQSPDDALSSSSSSLQVHTFNNVVGEETYSASEDCKRILEMEGGEGEKSVVKREKRELDRGINQRHWHVREVSDKLNELKCVTIHIPHPNLSFKDMYHYYTCKELGLGKAALGPVPRNCNACDETIRLPWESGKIAAENLGLKW